MKFSFGEEKNGNLSFLDVQMCREGNKFVTTVQRKPTFSGAYTHFHGFLSIAYKFNMIYTLAFRRFSICSNRTNVYELAFLKGMFLRNGYSISFIDKCSKKFWLYLNSYLKRPQVLTAENKTLTLVLLFLGELSLQTRKNLQEVFKSTLNCCKIQIVFKNQRKLTNIFRFKDRLPCDIVSCIVYKFQSGRCNLR